MPVYSLHASLLYCTACSDSLFFETTTIAPATGDVTADAYWASSTHSRWMNEIQPAQNGWTLPTEGYPMWLSQQMPPLPPGHAGYPARRLEELQAGTLSQRELHEPRVRIVAEDPWLQSLVPAYGGALGWTNSSLVEALERVEAEGDEPIADRYLHALVPRAPSMPVPVASIRRALHAVHHDHPPPLLPPGASHRPPPSPPPIPPGAPVTACPTAKPLEYTSCVAGANYAECHYDYMCCALTGECHWMVHTDCVPGDYWAHTHSHVECPEAMSPHAPPASPPPQLRGMDGDDWAEHLASLLRNPLLGHATQAADVDVRFNGGRELAFCVRPTGSDTVSGLLTSMGSATFVPALSSASGAHLFLKEPPEVSYATYALLDSR
jgi:hypothetical protein